MILSQFIDNVIFSKWKIIVLRYNLKFFFFYKYWLVQNRRFKDFRNLVEIFDINIDSRRQVSSFEYCFVRWLVNLCLWGFYKCDLSYFNVILEKLVVFFLWYLNDIVVFYVVELIFLKQNKRLIYFLCSFIRKE